VDFGLGISINSDKSAIKNPQSEIRNTITMDPQNLFKIVVVLYSVSNLLSLGLELNLKETINSLKSFRLIILTLGWGWVVSPAFAWLLTIIIPMDPSISLGLLITSIAPVAPFFPILVRNARADVNFSAAFMPLTMVITVVLMPIFVPIMMPGLTLSIWALAKPLLVLILFPMILGILIRIYLTRVADKIFPGIKVTAGITTVLSLVSVLLIYFREFIKVLGSYAILGQLILALGILLMAYYIGFGLKKNQRSAMALGMCSRNVSAMFAVYIVLPNPDPYLLVMILLSGPIPALTAYFVARYLGKKESINKKR
jgi:bile acid:Na+ symporter, BASS family